MDEWSVVRTSLDPVSQPDAGAIVAICCGIPQADAAWRFRSGRGILIRGLERSAAEKTAIELSAAGVPAVSAPDALTEPPPTPVPVRAASADGQYFHPQTDVSGVRQDLPWAEIGVVAAARVKEVRMRRPISAAGRRGELGQLAVQLSARSMIGLPASPSPSPHETIIHNYLDVLGGSPLQRYRVESTQFNYASLFPHPAPVAEANFCLLVTAILEMATGSLTNLRSGQIGTDRSLALAVFENEHEFGHQVHWLLALRRIGIIPARLGPTAREATVLVDQADSSKKSTGTS